VKGSDAEFTGTDSNVLGGQHSGIWRRLITISLDFHTTGNTDHSFLAGQIGDVNEGVVE